MHTDLADALRLVERDVASTLGRPLPLLDEESVDGEQVHSVWLLGPANTRTGVLLPESAGQVDGLVAVAEQVQEFVQEVEAVNGRSAWPECTFHPRTHPARAMNVGDVPLWTCPRTGDAIARIGLL